MSQPRKPQTALRGPEPAKRPDGVLTPSGRRVRQHPLPGQPPAPGQPGEARRPVPSWEEAQRVLFGTGVRAGLVARFRDGDSLVAAARDCHPYLGAYCAYLGRDRLASAPIRECDGDHGRDELERLRREYELLAAPWEERRLRGLTLDVRARGGLRKPDFDVVLRLGSAMASIDHDNRDRGLYDAGARVKTTASAPVAQTPGKCRRA
jgi:hypothetical protein